MTTETPIQLIRSVRNALREWGVDNDDTSINGIDARDYLTELLDRTNRILKDFYPEEYTTGKTVFDNVERVCAAYESDGEGQIGDILNSVAELAASFHHHRLAKSLAEAPTTVGGTMGRTIIVAGTPMSGFTFVGPFDNEEEAVEYAQHYGRFDYDWWTDRVNPPEATGG